MNAPSRSGMSGGPKGAKIVDDPACLPADSDLRRLAGDESRGFISGRNMAAHEWPMALLASLIFSVSHAGEAPELPGPELYEAFCASCHGTSAHGDGPIAPLLKIPVPDLTLIAARRGGKFSPKEMQRIIDGRFVIAAHGTREMPVWGSELYAYDGEDRARRHRVNEMIAELVAYLGAIQTVRVD